MQPDPAVLPEQVALDADGLIRDGLGHAWVHQAAWNGLAAPDGLKVFVRGEGCTIYDVHGRAFLDGLSGAWVVNVGHGRAEIAEAMAKQAAELAYVSAFNFLSPAAIQLANKLVQLTPDPLSRVFLCSGGAEAVEAALAMARQYHANQGQPGRHKVIARRTSYHGSAFGGKSLSGFRHAALQQRFSPLLPGVQHIAPPNCYRCEYGLEYPSCNVRCAREVENIILYEGPEAVAAVIGEPISVSGDTVVPVPEYWPIIRDICDRYGILLILDEVLNGMGRTGKWLASEHFGVVPDILTLSKGIASGYAPIGAVVVSERVGDVFMGDAASALAHGYTFGNHPVSSAAGLKNIEILEREQLVERAAEMGAYLMEGLRSLNSHPAVGDVRGLGLLAVVELVQDKATRARFGPEAQMPQRINQYLMEERVFLRVWDVIQVAPPFVVTHSEIDRIVAALDRALTKFESDIGLR